MEEDDGPPPPSPEKVKLESEESNELLVKKDEEDHSQEEEEEESKQIDDDEDEDEDEPPPLLEDMIDLLPPSSPLPPTPPLPSSPTDLNMEQQDSEDEGPPPGWDNKCQLKEQVEEVVTPAAISAISSEISDIKVDDVQQDARNEDGPQPQAHEHPSPTRELVPSDIKMEQEDSEDEGPPPGWDSKCQTTPHSEISDMKTEDVQQDAQDEDGAQPQAQAHEHLSPTRELVPSDIKVDQEDSEDEGPPPGWDSKCQLEPELQMACQMTPRSEISDMKTEDVQQDARDEDGPQPQPQAHTHEHLSPTRELAPSDIKVDQEDSEDEGPPPGWDSKCQPEPELQMACQTTPCSDIKAEDVQRDARDEDGPQPQAREHLSPTRELVPSVEQEDSEDEGPPPGWDSKCQPEPDLQMACQTPPCPDIKAEDVQRDSRDEDGPQPQPQAHEHPSPTRELVMPDIKVEQEDSEDEGPPPGWDSKCQTEPGLQMACQMTPSSDFKMENDEQDEEGPPPGWGSTPQQQSQDHSSVPSPIVTSGARMGCEQNNLKVVEERPQQPSRQQSIPPTKPQISAPKPPTPVNNNSEMGQMVCGSCRRLLSYPRGARYVECACCLEENYVLEEHEVGQVVCEGCNVLLMYPYGAPKVRCANCRSETEIGDQNRRPPLSEHRRRAKRHLKRMHSG